MNQKEVTLKQREMSIKQMTDQLTKIQKQLKKDVYFNSYIFISQMQKIYFQIIYKI